MIYVVKFLMSLISLNKKKKKNCKNHYCCNLRLIEAHSHKQEIETYTQNNIIKCGLVNSIYTFVSNTNYSFLEHFFHKINLFDR